MLIWFAASEQDARSLPHLASRRLRPADLETEPVALRGETIRLQCYGTVPEAGTRCYVERRGMYELLGVETWVGGRRLMTLRACPVPSGGRRAA